MRAPLADRTRRSPTPGSRPRARPAACALILAVVLCPAAAHAISLRTPEPFVRAGRLYVETTLEEPFDPGVAQSLQGGMPVTVTVRAQLWHRRRGWFDRQVGTFSATMRIGYETLRERYRVQHSSEPIRYYDNLDSLTNYVTRPWSMPLAPLGSLGDRAVYYVNVEATIKPLTLEDATAVEGWLAGGEDGGGSGGFGFLAGLPRALFEAARGVAGFGDRQARAVSRNFSRP